MDNLRKISSLLERINDGIVFKGELDKFIHTINDKIDRIIATEKEISRKRRNKKIAIISIIIVIAISSIIAVCIGNITKNAGYSADKFEIQVLSKTNDEYNETLADGYSGSGYFYTFNFHVENNSPNKVKTIYGNMDVNSVDGRNLSSSIVTMKGSLNAQSDASWNIQLNVYKGDNAREIWDTDFNSLEVTFRITRIIFDDGTDKTYTDTKNKIVHSIDKINNQQNDDNSIKNASNDTFGEMLNETIENGETLLEWLHHDVGDDVIIPDEGFDYISYSNNCSCPTADYSVNYTGSYVFFEIEEDYVEIFVSDFKQKLVNNGWTLVCEDCGDYEYKKGNTHIHFGSVRPSYVYHQAIGEEVLEYYYFNYYAYNT